VNSPRISTTVTAAVALLSDTCSCVGSPTDVPLALEDSPKPCAFNAQLNCTLLDMFGSTQQYSHSISAGLSAPHRAAAQAFTDPGRERTGAPERSTASPQGSCLLCFLQRRSRAQWENVSCIAQGQAGAVTDWGWVTVTVLLLLPRSCPTTPSTTGLRQRCLLQRNKSQWHPCPIRTVITQSPRALRHVSRNRTVIPPLITVGPLLFTAFFYLSVLLRLQIQSNRQQHQLQWYGVLLATLPTLSS